MPRTGGRQLTLRQGPEGSPNSCFGPYDEAKYNECVVFVDSDWCYAGLASSCGWNMRRVQQCQNPRCNARLPIVPDGQNYAECDRCHKISVKCDHDGTDGTARCRDCNVVTGAFLADAFDYLSEHDGETFEVHDYNEPKE